jgi:hypothetical protein
MKKITIEKEVWTSELGTNHAEMSKIILGEEYFKIYGPPAISSKFEFISIKIEYGHFREVQIGAKRPPLQYNNKATITGILLVD